MHIKEFFDVLESDLNLGMIKDVEAFMDGNKDKLTRYSISVINSNELLIDVNFIHYSISLVKDFISSFISFVSYDYLSICYKETINKTILYHFYTATEENRKGIKVTIKVL